MTATACADPVCAAMVAVFIPDPADDLVVQPCPRCGDALADGLAGEQAARRA